MCCRRLELRESDGANDGPCALLALLAPCGASTWPGNSKTNSVLPLAAIPSSLMVRVARGARKARPGLTKVFGLAISRKNTGA
jgi:hypothetical protein